ncbi:MAG: DUF2125 domain-containing protein [Rhizobiaceae bacterium]
MAQKEKSFFAHSMAKWGLFLVFLFGLWFAGWFMFARFADGKIGETLAMLESRGVNVDCDKRAIKGFPFRIGVHCDGVRVSDPNNNLNFESGALRTTAILYAPGEMIAELDSPMKFSPGGQETTATWKTMRVFADATFSGGFDLISFTYSDLDLQSFMTKLTVGEGGLHLRPSVKNAADLDIAGNANDTQLVAGTKLNTPPASFNFDAVVDEGYSKFITERRSLGQVLIEGLSVTLRSGVLKVADGGQLALAGPLELHRDGTVSGNIRIGITKPEAVAAWAGKVNPQLQQIIAGVGQAIAGMGKKSKFSGQEMPSITVKIKHGVARLGFIQLGKIPSLKIN